MDIQSIISSAKWTQNNIDALIYEGYNFIESESFSDAISCLYVSSALNPKNWYSLMLLGAAYIGDKNYKEALFTLERASEISSDPKIDIQKIVAHLASNNSLEATLIAKKIITSNNETAKNFASGILEIVKLQSKPS